MSIHKSSTDCKSSSDSTQRLYQDVVSDDFRESWLVKLNAASHLPITSKRLAFIIYQLSDKVTNVTKTTVTDLELISGCDWGDVLQSFSDFNDLIAVDAMTDKDFIVCRLRTESPPATITPTISERAVQIFVDAAHQKSKEVAHDIMAKSEAFSQSPMESLFAAAFQGIGHGCGAVFCLAPDTVSSFSGHYDPGHAVSTFIIPQMPVEKWRVDFFVGVSWNGNIFEACFAAVEIDGHDFHEKTKDQASRDKEKDRDITGYLDIPVFRYTGRDIYREAISHAARLHRFLYLKSKDGVGIEAATRIFGDKI